MFTSFRRKPKFEDDFGTGATVASSPATLPQLGTAQGALQWPESLIDVSTVQGTNSNTTGLPQDTSPKRPGGASARKASFSKGDGRGPIPFHKPFRTPDGPISSLYTSTFAMKVPVTPSLDGAGEEKPKAGLVGKGAPRRFATQKRPRPPPNTFNIMVAGGQSTGKTSLLRLLLDTSEFSSRASEDQKAAVERFLRGSAPKKTKTITTACVETADSRHEHVLLSVVDTPGLDYAEGRELKLDRQVSAILKYVEAQYADTLKEENKVVRTSKGDQHIHLCIFMIDPALVMTARSRRDLSSLPSKTRSDISLSRRPSLSGVHAGDTSGDESDDESGDVLTMSPVELRAMRRIAARCNILPVISHSDTLTNERLAQVRGAVRRDMAFAGLDFGVFGSPPMKVKTPRPDVTSTQPGTVASPPSTEEPILRVNGSGTHHAAPESDEGSADEERPSRSVIKLRAGRHASVRKLSRSRSRRDLSALKEEMDDSPIMPSSYHRDSVHNVRFSAHLLHQKDTNDLLPFAFIAPEGGKRSSRPKTRRPVSMNSQTTNGASRPVSPTFDSEQMPMPLKLDVAVHPAGGVHGDALSPPPTATEPEYLSHPPIDPLKGVYVRKYKWGTIDVLEPEHCDFAALRTSIMSTNMKALRTRTRQVLYEKYRMEKLLARRATAHITDDQRKQLLEELGL